MKTIALKRLNLLAASKGVGLSNDEKFRVLTELAKLGYRISNPSLLAKIDSSFLFDLDFYLNTLKEQRGAKEEHVHLFKNFPNSIPEDLNYLIDRSMGYLTNEFTRIEDGIELESGLIVPDWLFSVYEFGADPISQMQSKKLFTIAVKDEAAKKDDVHVEWIELRIVLMDQLKIDLNSFLEKMIYSKSSIKSELQTDLIKLIDFFGINILNPELIVFKETKSFILKYCWNLSDLDGIVKLNNTATDVLRMFAAVTETDVSLTQKIKFPKMNRKMRKTILSILENSPSLANDVKTYKDLWLEIGRYLHPFEYKKQFPKTAKVFDTLRNGKIETFYSVTERFIAEKELNDLLIHLQSKPGIYARKLHEVLRKFPIQQNTIIESFSNCIKNVQLKNLLVMKRYFESINESEYRTVINKKGKVIVIENNSISGLSEHTLKALSDLIENTILLKMEEKESWSGKTVWVDPKLKDFTVPLSQRSGSDGLLNIGRGSKIDLDVDKVLRLFVYWKENGQRTDYDLSVMQMDDEFKYLGHVSYTRLKDSGIVHSGDIQSAPLGATEYIDITMSKLNSKVKYLALQINKFAGSNFSEIECNAGWMIREKVDSNRKTFDVKTVANKFSLTNNGAFSIPIIVDIEASQLIVTDLFISGKAIRNTVEGAKENVGIICSEISNFTLTKPTLLDLSIYNSLGRKACFVESKEEADISFGYDDCTYNVNDVETILSELI